MSIYVLQTIHGRTRLVLKVFFDLDADLTLTIVGGAFKRRSLLDHDFILKHVVFYDKY